MEFNQREFEKGLKELGEKNNIPNLEQIVHTGQLSYEKGMRLHIPEYLSENLKKEIDKLFDKVAAIKE